MDSSDLERLLSPIREDAPAGDDLRDVTGDLTLERIEDLRREYDPGDNPDFPEGKSGDWVAVLRECDEQLAERSKDLEIAVHRAEAAARHEGLPGLRDGLRLLHELLSRFGETLHPRDADYRRSLIERLTGTRRAIGSLEQLPVIRPAASEPLHWGRKREADRVELARLEQPARYTELLRSGATTAEAWDAAVGAAGPEHLAEVLHAAYACQEEAERLAKVCDPLFAAEDRPNLTPLGELLGEISAYLEKRVPQPGRSGEAEDSSAAPSAPVPTGPITTRADAIRMLREVAAFFQQTEPHSPVSYLVERAARWGETPLQDLLREVVKSDDVLDQIWDTLGIRNPGSESGEGD